MFNLKCVNPNRHDMVRQSFSEIKIFRVEEKFAVLMVDLKRINNHIADLEMSEEMQY